MFKLDCLVFAALAEHRPHNLCLSPSLLTTVLQGSVHPGLSLREAAQRAGGGAEDGLRGAQEPRLVPWSDTQTGNTQDGQGLRCFHSGLYLGFNLTVSTTSALCLSNNR